MQDSINDVFLHRFLKRETRENENDEIFRWVSSSEANRSEFKKAHELFHLDDLKRIRNEIDIDAAWEKLNQQLPKENKRARIVYMSILQKIAISLLFLLIIGGGSIWVKEYFSGISKSAIVQFEAPMGEKSKVLLADGSKVWLNSKTIIRYDAQSPRNVFLDGEAFFEVKKDSKHPFEVRTLSGIKIRVTGTKFNLKSYSDEPFVETTLSEGGVVISRNDQEIVELKPGQQARYNLKKEELKVESVLPEVYSVWKENELQFSGVSFRELIPKIERWYGVSIDLDPKISDKDHFTMTIKTESLRELLNMMQLTSKFTYEINGSIVKIHVK